MLKTYLFICLFVCLPNWFKMLLKTFQTLIQFQFSLPLYHFRSFSFFRHPSSTSRQEVNTDFDSGIDTLIDLNSTESCSSWKIDDDNKARDKLSEKLWAKISWSETYQFPTSIWAPWGMENSWKKNNSDAFSNRNSALASLQGSKITFWNVKRQSELKI